jgi:hypothetical protein
MGGSFALELLHGNALADRRYPEVSLPWEEAGLFLPCEVNLVAWWETLPCPTALVAGVIGACSSHARSTLLKGRSSWVVSVRPASWYVGLTGLTEA